MKPRFNPIVQITPEILERIHHDDELMYKLAKGLNKDMMTVKRWLRDPEWQRFLVEQKALAIICKHLGLSEAQITEPIHAIAE